MAQTSVSDPDCTSYKKMLIKAVKKHPELYDPTCLGYRNHRTKTSAWQEMSDSLERPVNEIRKDWGKLRKNYIRWQKKSETGNPTIKWKYFKRMKFIFPYIKIKSEEPKSSDTIARILPEEEDDGENGIEGSDLSVLRETDKDSTQNIMQYTNHSTIDSDNHSMNMNHSFGIPTLYPGPVPEDSDRLFLLSFTPNAQRFGGSLKIVYENQIFEHAPSS